MKNFHILLLGLLFCLFGGGGAGCSVQSNEELEAARAASQKVPKPEEIVAEVRNRAYTGQVFILVDTSGSTPRSLIDAGVEKASSLVKDAQVVVVPITSDSMSSTTAPYADGPVPATMCWHQPVPGVETDYVYRNIGTEKKAYEAAAERVAAEMEGCNATLPDPSVELAEFKANLTRHLHGLPRSGHTDIEGAFARVQRLRDDSKSTTVIVLSDMKQELPQARSQELALNLAGAQVYVLEYQANTYKPSQEVGWRSRLETAGATVEWKAFVPTATAAAPPEPAAPAAKESKVAKAPAPTTRRSEPAAPPRRDPPPAEPKPPARGFK